MEKHQCQGQIDLCKNAVAFQDLPQFDEDDESSDKTDNRYCFSNVAEDLKKGSNLNLKSLATKNSA